MDLDEFCKCAGITNKSDHVLEKHVKDVLFNHIQPIFKKQVKQHPTLTKKKLRYQGDSELHEEQLWKSNQTVPILRWIVEGANPKELEDNIHLLIPPVLIVLDDYDVKYKTIGVNMVHLLIKKLSPSFISKTHLDNVFLESLFHCLYYLSQDRDIELLESTYPCLLDIISNTKKGREQFVLYERVMTDGIATGLLHAGQKIRFLSVLLQQIPIVVNGLDSASVQYLKAIIPPLCESMAISPINTDMRTVSKTAADGLVVVMQVCWPRIFAYRGIIIQSLARSWSFYFEKQDLEMMETLRHAYKVFEAACDGKEQADKEALLEFKPQVFRPLFL